MNKYSGVIYDDITNGKGIGYTIFTQYCTHHCKGCQNPTTWDINGGELFTENELNNMIQYFKTHSYADHLALSGGDPIDSFELSYLIASKFKENFPYKKLWIWTGYQIEELLKDDKYLSLLELCDILIDGEFILEERDITLKFRGSSNQRLINVQETLKQNKVVLYDI